jgi:hypothetical protein
MLRNVERPLTWTAAIRIKTQRHRVNREIKAWTKHSVSSVPPCLRKFSAGEKIRMDQSVQTVQIDPIDERVLVNRSDFVPP